jgi:hypothetical protein
MTGGSGPIDGLHNKHVRHEQVGDHRQGGNFHTGPAKQSKVTHTQPGHPAGNGGKLNGVDR